jgi:hypothetical protein
LFAALASIVSQAWQPPPEGTQTWMMQLDDPGAVVGQAWSSSSSCIAIATDTSVQVIDREGRLLWLWKVPQKSHLIRFSHGLAVSPACDAIAIPGWADYRYVWTATRDGHPAFFKTKGTPEIVAFSLDGDTIAVATAASRAYLLSPQLEPRWSGKLADLPVRWPAQTHDATDARVEFSKNDVDDLFSVTWGQGQDDSVSDDGGSRVQVTFPYRSTDPTEPSEVSFWGHGAEGYRLRYVHRPPRWTKMFACAHAGVTSDGLFVVVAGKRHGNYGADGLEDDCEDHRVPISIFDRAGKTVVTWPHGRSTEDLRAAVLARTGKPLLLGPPRRGEAAWVVPSTPEERQTHVSARHAASPDGKMSVAAHGRVVRMYRAPE